MIRKAEIKDLSRIAEIQVFNYRLYFYPIFQCDEYYFSELQVPSLMHSYESELDSLYVYDDGVVKGFIKIENTYIDGYKRYEIEQSRSAVLCGGRVADNLCDADRSRHITNTVFPCNQVR